MLPLCDNLPARTLPALTLAVIALQALLRMPAAPGAPWVELTAVRVGSPDEPSIMLLGPLSLWQLLLAGAFLWWSGSSLEARLGGMRYLGLVSSAALVGAAVQAQFGWSSPFSLLNASVSGVLGAYLTLYPRAQLLVLVPAPVLLVELPAIPFVALWLLLHAVAAFTPLAGTGSLEHVAVATSFGWGCLHALAFAPPVRWGANGTLTVAP